MGRKRELIFKFLLKKGGEYAYMTVQKKRVGLSEKMADFFSSISIDVWRSLMITMG